MKIGLIGDHDDTITAHRAIPLAFELIKKKYNTDICYEWLATNSIGTSIDLTMFNGLWCVPGSPYQDMEGALSAIQYARQNNRPFLGTCGGFQHAIIEYAWNHLGLSEAKHAEISPEADSLVITPLVCSLIEKEDTIEFIADSKIAIAYGKKQASEGYRCSFGFNPAFESEFLSDNFVITGRDDDGQARVFELVNHPFFVATLFQPERVALKDEIPPLVLAFIQHCSTSKN